AHVPDRANAPIHPAAPVEGMVDGVVVDVRRSAQKKIPRERVRSGEAASHGRGEARIKAGLVPAKSIGRDLERLRAGHALRPDGAVGPDVDFAHVADSAGPDV